VLEFLKSLDLLKIWSVLSSFSLFVGVAILVYHLIPDEEQLVAQRRLGVDDEKGHRHRITLLKYFRPLYRTLVPWLAQKNFDKLRPRLQRDLITANIRDEMTPDEFIGFRIVLAVVIPLLVAYISMALGFSLPWVLWPGVIILGFFAPDIWLKDLVKARRREIIRAMPYTLDLLTLSVEANLDFIAAIQKLTQRSKTNALIEEFAHMLKEIRLGTSRSDALRSLSDRLNIEEISSFTTLLIQADQLGASIGEVLRAQSDQLRVSRFQAAEMAGAKASQLVLFPLGICIFPSIFIVVLGPAILNFIRAGFL